MKIVSLHVKNSKHNQVFLMYDPTNDQRNIMNLLKMCDIFEVKYISLHSRYGNDDPKSL